MLTHNKDDIEFVSEFPCFLGHLYHPCFGVISALSVNYHPSGTVIILPSVNYYWVISVLSVYYFPPGGLINVLK